MILRVEDRSGEVFTYTNAEMAAGELVVNQKLSSSGGIEVVENGDVEVAVYNDFLGYPDVSTYFDEEVDQLCHLRCQLEVGGKVVLEGSIYEGDLSFDDLDLKFILLLLGDAEEEARDRLRTVALRSLNVTSDLEEVVFTSGAPVSKDVLPLYSGTIEHETTNDGDDPENPIVQEFGGWQSVGAVHMWDPVQLMEAALPAAGLAPDPDYRSATRLTLDDLEDGRGATSGRDVRGTLGVVPRIEPANVKYRDENGLEQTLEYDTTTCIFQVNTWDGPMPETGAPNKSGLPDWTGEELLDYYLIRTGRRLICRYEAFPSSTIYLQFCDDTTRIEATQDLTTLTEGAFAEDPRRGQDYYDEGLTVDERREQDWPTVDIDRPRMPDLAVKIGEIREASLTADDFGRPHHLDVWQRGGNTDAHRNDDPKYTPHNGGFYSLGQYRRAWYWQQEDGPGIYYEDYYSASPVPPKARYAAVRWGAGRDTKVVEQNETTVSTPTKIPQFLQAYDLGLTRRRGESQTAARQIFDPWRDPFWRPDKLISSTGNAHSVDRGFADDLKLMSGETNEDDGNWNHLYSINNIDQWRSADVSQFTDYHARYVFGYPVIPFESDEVYEVAVSTTRQDVEGAFDVHERPRSLMWVDARLPGNHDQQTREAFFEIAVDKDFRQTNGDFDVNAGAQWAATAGLSRGTEYGIAGLHNPTWAYNIFEYRRASRAIRLTVTVEMDVSGRDLAVGDPSRGVFWQDEAWLITEMEQLADRPVATLTLERYIEPETELYSETRYPTIGKPRNATDQLVLTYEIDSQAQSDADNVRSVRWEPPEHEDEAGVFYYEVQSSYKRVSEPLQRVWYRLCVTRATVLYTRFSPTVSDRGVYAEAFRVRAVGFPDSNGNVQTSDWVYPKKQPVRLLRDAL